MNKTEYLLVSLSEECAEAQQAISKSLRFGLDDKYEDCPSPRENIKLEINDLLAIIEMLEEDGILDKLRDPEAIVKKKEKVLFYMNYAKEHGTLID